MATTTGSMSLADFNNLPDADQGNSQQAQAPSNPTQSTGSMSLADFNKLPNADQTVKMVGPQGQQVVVPQNQIAAMRQKNFSVAPDSPGARPMIAPTSQEGTLFYADPSEVDNLVRAGNHAQPTDAEKKILDDDLAKGRAQQSSVAKLLGMQPSAQSPEAQAIRDKLQNWEALMLANSELVKTQLADKAIGTAIVATPAVIGTGAAAGSALFGSSTVPGLITAGGEEVVGQSLARQGATWVGKQLAKKAVGAVGTVGTVDILGKLLKWW